MSYTTRVFIMKNIKFTLNVLLIKYISNYTPILCWKSLRI